MELLKFLYVPVLVKVLVTLRETTPGDNKRRLREESKRFGHAAAEMFGWQLGTETLFVVSAVGRATAKGAGSHLLNKGTVNSEADLTERTWIG